MPKSTIQRTSKSVKNFSSFCSNYFDAVKVKLLMKVLSIQIYLCHDQEVRAFQLESTDANDEMDVSDDENYASSSNSKRARIDKPKKKVENFKVLFLQKLLCSFYSKKKLKKKAF